MAVPDAHLLFAVGRAHARIRRYHEEGAGGLKLYVGHGYVAPGATDYLFSSVAIDDSRMDSVYKYCEANCLPVCLHLNPEKPGFADEFVTLLHRHPRLLVNAPHWILSSRNADRLTELLDVFPNLVTDISFGADEFLIAGLRRISSRVSRMRQVIELHHERFIFGTDFVITRCKHKTIDWMNVRVQAYRSMLSCAQYHTELVPGELLNGLALPAGLVRKIEADNYRQFRAPGRPLAEPSRSLDESRLGVPGVHRSPGERLRPNSVSTPFASLPT
jgi:hypothetical protein